MKKHTAIIILVVVIVLVTTSVWFINSYKITKMASTTTGVGCMAMVPECGYCSKVKIAGYCIEPKS
jgi:ABC-type uncharacterized transport system permease subunit